MHLVVDALGLPLAFEVTEGQRNDIVPAKELASRAQSRCLIATRLTMRARSERHSKRLVARR